MIKLLELFGGIGACSRALDHLGIEYEIADYVEIDKYAVQSYNAIHGTHFEPQDVTKWDKQLDIDLIMHGSPCQDFSIAGKNMGGNEGSGTRSSLMYETIRIVSNLKPKYVLWENVKNLLSEKHIYNFYMYLDKMDELGYRNYYKVLNAKDYGIPQNRERVFTVSIRKDIKEEFVMPEPFPLDKRLKDLLEDEVDEKYYLSDELLNYFLRNNKVQEFKGNNFSFGYSDGDVVANSITPKNGQRMTDNFVSVKQIGNLTRNANRENPNRGRLYDQNGLSPTLGTMEGGNLQPFVPVLLGGIGEKKPNNGTQFYQQDRVYSADGVAMAHPANLPDGSYKYAIDEQNKLVRDDGTVGTITTDGSSPKHNNRVSNGLRIRKLTPRECWRLMGFDDQAFDQAEKVCSNSQLYKQAGNSIVVDVLEKILTNLLINPQKLEKEQMSIFDFIERDKL